jgi:uncharacterized membrane protein YfcA
VIALLPILLGSTAGLALGLVGGGGSILTVPLLVGVLGVPPREATTMSLVIVGISALWAAIPHARRGNVRWGRAALFGAVGLVGTAIGGQLNRAVPPEVLLLGFSVVMVAAAIAMLRRAGAVGRVPAVRMAVSPIVYVGAGAPASLASGTTGAPALTTRLRAMLPAHCPLIDHGPFVATAVGVGLLTGFFGVGGGFLIVPALVLVLRLPMPIAIGTSLPIIAINSGTALAGHLAAGRAIDLPVTVLFTAGAIGGALLGGAFSTRLPAVALARAFAVLVLVLAAYLAFTVLAA